MTWVDYMALIAVLRGCYVGYKSGLFPEVLRISAYLVTVIVTLRFYEPFGQWLTLKTFLNLTTATAVSVFALLVGMFALSKLLTVLLLKLLKLGEGGFFYRLAGLVVGTCRWVILLSLVFMAVEHSPLVSLKSDIKERSVTGPWIAKVAPSIFDFLSKVSPQLAVQGERP